LQNNGTAFTNTFVGTVVTPSGGSVTNTINTGFQLAGSPTPYGDIITNQTTINLGASTVSGGTTLEIWNQTAGKFVTYLFSGGNWTRNSNVTNPPVAVGQGFFINSGTAANWVQTLP
jgi:hypothetical protein